jgi:2-oxoglutarate ferredoxin oxidoreductase subunit gamma
VATFEITIAGFGGQGILFAGEILARAAVLEGKNVTLMPSYGPEQRGGTATCTVVVSDEPIGSPIVSDPQAAIVMNRPSLDKFEPWIRPGGVLVVNTAMVDRPIARADLRVIGIDATGEAAALGNAAVANMILLGVLLRVLPVVSVGAVRRALAERFAPSQQDLVEIDVAAVDRGLDAGSMCERRQALREAIKIHPRPDGQSGALGPIF